MKTTATIALLMAGLSFNALAIENGTSVNWNDYNDMVKLNNSVSNAECSGTAIAGKYILTAAHCVIHSDRYVDQAITAEKQSSSIIKVNSHPNFNEHRGNWHDVAISELNQTINTQHIHFFADLTNNTVKLNDNLRIFGFGNTQKNLSYANLEMIDLGLNPEDRLDGEFINQGNTIGGDSGGSWLDTNNNIVSVHSGSSTFPDGRRETYSTNLHYAKDFILETINGWHYPTLANTSNGSVTIKVQSLHDTNAAYDATTSGDAQIIGSTCESTIQPFQTCTYTIESQGGTGTLHLSDSESITINKPAPTTESSGGGDSGGSLGFLSLIGLFGLGFIRHKNANK